jgi:hypothetical protein
VTDTTPPKVSNDPANDGYAIRNADERRQQAACDRDDEDDEARGDAGDKAPKVGEGILDGIEDAIPGDSDDDGH